MKLTKHKIVILIASMVAGECAALFLILALVLSAEPAASVQVHSTAPDVNEESTLSPGPAFDITAEIEVTGRLVSIKEDMLLKEKGNDFVVYVPSTNFAYTEIVRVASNGVDVGFTQKDAYLEIHSPSVMDKLYIEYKITLAESKDILSYSEDRILLCNFLATPAVYRNGSPILTGRYDFGDPYVYDVNDYHITFRTDRDLSVYAPGKKDEVINGEKKTTIFEARNLRDFSSVLLSKASIKTDKIGNTIIYYIDSYDSAVHAGQAFRFAEEKIGPYLHEELFIVRAPITLNGMELSNMILLSDSCFDNKELLKGVVYHEIFHQWFYWIIGTDQINEPFFDEGLVNYLASYLCNYKPRKNFSQNFLQLTLKDYKSRQQYYNNIYQDAAAYFGQLHQTLGDRFFLLLQDIYAQRKFTILYFEEFLKLADEYLRGQ